jgi:hypothetical protein
MSHLEPVEGVHKLVRYKQMLAMTIAYPSSGTASVPDSFTTTRETIQTLGSGIC